MRLLLLKKKFFGLDDVSKAIKIDFIAAAAQEKPNYMTSVDCGESINVCHFSA